MKNVKKFLFFIFVISLLSVTGVHGAPHEYSGVPQNTSNRTFPLLLSRVSDRAQMNGLISRPGAVSPGDRLTINLSADVTYISNIERVETDVNGVLIIRGDIEGDENGYLLFSSYGGHTHTTIRVYEPDEIIIISYNSELESHIIYESKPEDMDWIESGPPLIPPGAIHIQETEPPPEIEEDVTIDVMIVYTPSAKNHADNYGGINNVIAQAMERSRMTTDNSDTGINFRLVYSAEVDYEEYRDEETRRNDTRTDLLRLTDPEDGYMDEVHIWRDNYDADLVVLLTNATDSGGMAWQLTDPSGSPDRGFSITRVQQAYTAYTTVHEMGHNLGAHHSTYQEEYPGPGIFSYSAGWRWVESSIRKYATVMAYSEGIYTIVPHFSNPDIEYRGLPTGCPEDGDNARTLRQTKTVVSEYRPALADPPFLNAALDDFVDEDILIAFEDDAEWRDNIKSLHVNDNAVEPDFYSVEEGNITLYSELFNEPGNYFVRIKADGYIDATVVLSINMLSSEKEIKTFVFTEQTAPAVIDADARTVEAEVAYDADITNLTAEFTLFAWAEVDGVLQVSGKTANDFSNPVTYTIIAEDGSEADWVVSVTREVVPVESVSLNTNRTEIVEGETETLIAAVYPDYADNTGVRWESDNHSVGVVDEAGKITALETGVTTIRVITDDGNHTDECTVIVTGEDWMIEESTALEVITVEDGTALIDFHHLGIRLSVIAEDEEGVVAVTRFSDSRYDLPPALLSAGLYLNINLSKNFESADVSVEISFDRENLPDYVIEENLILLMRSSVDGSWEVVPEQEVGSDRLIITGLTEISPVGLFDPVVFGDVTLEGTVKVGDAIKLLRYLVGLEELSPAQYVRAGVYDGKSKLSINDAVLILRFIVGLIDYFPVEK